MKHNGDRRCNSHLNTHQIARTDDDAVKKIVCAIRNKDHHTERMLVRTVMEHSGKLFIKVFVCHKMCMVPMKTFLKNKKQEHAQYDRKPSLVGIKFSKRFGYQVNEGIPKQCTDRKTHQEMRESHQEFFFQKQRRNTH